MFYLRLRFSPFFHVRLKSSKSTFFLCTPNSILVFAGKLAFKKFVLKRDTSLGTCRMTELVETSAFRYGVSDEETIMIETESFSYGSSGFDILSRQFESKLNELSKWLVSGLFCVVILSRHDPESMWAAMGSVVNSAISVVLKRILNQERPVATLRSDPGMPSSHAQSITFIAVFVILSIVEWLGMNALALTLSGVTILLASYLTWLRVSQQLHTLSQVGVGAVLGSGFALFWFWFWTGVVGEAYVYFLWVRVVVSLGATMFCLGFIAYVIKNWLRTER